MEISQGVAMGTSCEPSYANLFLGAWERRVFANDAYTPYLQCGLCWYRFIDDIFIIWTGSSKLLKEFIQILKHIPDNLFFTYTFDDSQIPYLDLKIMKNVEGTLGTDLFRKPTAGNTLLCASSVHPHSLVQSIP